jgi:2-polyprenyl-3-methyl-5-hydroxy-6-metoxy-1,4-benzoquinol methylase
MDGAEDMMNIGVAPSGYHEKHYAARCWRFYRELLALAIQYSEPGPILDVGAGVGLLLEAAQRWNLTCLGLEGSAEAIAIARERCESLNLKRHLLSDAFPVGDCTFQTVYLNQVIEHLEPAVAETCVAECWRVLRPGGMFIVMSPSKLNKRERDADPTHICLYSPSSLKRLLASKGFVNIRALDAPMNFLGQSLMAKRVMKIIFTLTRWERLSSSANCMAWKPTILL